MQVQAIMLHCLPMDDVKIGGTARINLVSVEIAPTDILVIA
jgi:hypothetical protein